MKRQVILITDGDKYARLAVEQAGKELGCQTIICSAGNPTSVTGHQLIEEILNCSPDCEPILVMFDDGGFNGEGRGEKLLKHVATHPSIEPIGAVAVASNSDSQEWTRVDVSVDRFGNLTPFGVDKEGIPELEKGRLLGDTVYSLDELDLPIVVGVGDIGKLRGIDDAEHGAPITRQALELILERSESYRSKQ